MKEGMIQISGYDNLYYDSNAKQYKSKMFCPYCGKHSGCWCYPDFERVPLFEEDFPINYCSDRHFVLDMENLDEIAGLLKITIKPTMEEWNASKIAKAFFEDFDGVCDYSAGGGCEV